MACFDPRNVRVAIPAPTDARDRVLAPSVPRQKIEGTHRIRPFEEPDEPDDKAGRKTMIFTETKLPGAYIIDLEPIEDARGFFARAWDEEELAEQGLKTRIAQCNISFSKRRGTLRGMHFQRAPYEEVKLVRCVRGALYDVIIDLRSGSPTYKHWAGVELNAEDRRSLYVPRGFAHGFQTLEDDTETFYMVSEFYMPGAEGGVRWDDPAFGIDWPLGTPTEISQKDASWGDFAG
jgi:dTDP-4-dehydrorhamnose 3,5-epimerase